MFSFAKLFIFLVLVASVSAQPSNIYNCTASLCSFNGVCKTTVGTIQDTCKCNDGYVTSNTLAGIGCDYKQYDQLTAFLLEFFFGFGGGGFFYIQSYTLGITQLCLSVVGLCPMCIMVAIFSENKTVISACYCYALMVLFTIIGLDMYAIIEFGRNVILDGKNLPLKSW